MAALDFPSSPVSGQQYTANNTTFTYNGTKWVRVDSSKRIIPVESADSLRTENPQDNDQVHVLGVGSFVFKTGSTEIDDGETCFATVTGRWLLENVHFDVVEDQISESVDAFKSTLTQTLTQTLTGKQDVLVSEQNIRTLNGQSILKTVSDSEEEDVLERDIKTEGLLHDLFTFATGLPETEIPVATATGNGLVVVITKPTAGNARIWSNKDPYTTKFIECSAIANTLVSNTASVEFLNGIFVIMEPLNSYIYVSSDTINWEFVTLPHQTPSQFSRIGKSNSHFIILDIVNGSLTRLSYSKNGIDWKYTTLGTNNASQTIKSVIANDKLVMANTSTKICIYEIDLNSKDPTSITGSVQILTSPVIFKKNEDLCYFVNSGSFITTNIIAHNDSATTSVDNGTVTLAFNNNLADLTYTNNFLYSIVDNKVLAHRKSNGTPIQVQLDQNTGFSVSGNPYRICSSEDTLFYISNFTGVWAGRVAFNSNRNGRLFNGKNSGYVSLEEHRNGRVLSGSGKWIDHGRHIKNILDNGKFEIDELNRSADNLSSVQNTYAYLYDRWILKSASIPVNINVSRSTDVPNSEYRYSIQVSNSSELNLAAGDYITLSQFINKERLYGFVNRPLTASFWFYQNAFIVSSLNVSLFNSITNDTYCVLKPIIGFGGWQYVEVTFPNGVNQNSIITGTWFNITIAAHTSFMTSTPEGWEAGKVYVKNSTSNMFSGGSRTVRFTGIQLEQGEGSSGFDHRPYQEELRICSTNQPGFRPRAADVVIGQGIGISNNTVKISIPLNEEILFNINSGLTDVFVSGASTCKMTDGVNTYTCNGYTVSSESSNRQLVLDFTIATTDIVQFRPYFLKTVDNTTRFHIVPYW